MYSTLLRSALRFLNPALIVICATSVWSQESLEYRRWTDESGQFTVEAALKSQTVDSVTLVLRNGSTIKVESARLSATDKDYLSAQSNAATRGTTMEHAPKIKLLEEKIKDTLVAAPVEIRDRDSLKVVLQRIGVPYFVDRSSLEKLACQ